MAEQLKTEVRRKLQEQGYLTLPEVAEHYRTTPGTVRYWRHCGYGPRGVKLGTRVLYPVDEIRRFDAELAGQAADAASA
jgi:hypothetical protein